MSPPRTDGPAARRVSFALFLLLALAGGVAAPARSQDARGPAAGEDDGIAPGSIIQKVKFDQHLDAQLPLNLKFRDEEGKTVTLADYFGSKPVILTLGYYRCPLICGQEWNSLARSLKPLSLDFGKDFEVVTISIDPTEKPPLAKDKKANLLKRYGRPGAEKGWHFLTGDEDQIRPLADAAGFVYVYNEKNSQYVHPAGLIVATPEGRISRYFFGIEFPAKDLQFTLIEASAGKIGSPVAKLLMFCYDYDPTSGKYTLAVVFLIRTLGALTALALGIYIVAMLIRDRRRAAMAKAAADLIETRSA